MPVQTRQENWNSDTTLVMARSKCTSNGVLKFASETYAKANQKLKQATVQGSRLKVSIPRDNFKQKLVVIRIL
jgi:hypothetical protein